MSEQQAPYDTDDPQPTPGPTFDSGPWEAEGPPLTGEVVDRSSGAVWAADGDLVAETHASPVYGEPSYDRACLIAAAGTAASELGDEYDAMATARGIPERLAALERARRYFRKQYRAGERGALRASILGEIERALEAARGETDE